MRMNTIIQRIPAWYKSKLSIYLRGPIGRGKTTAIEEAVELLNRAYKGNYGVVIVSGPLLNPPDAVGYLMPQRVEQHLESVFTEPFWFRTKKGKYMAGGEHLNDFDGGIILIDEMDKCDIDVKKVIGEACLSNRLGPHIIPESWVVWGTGNRAEDMSGSTKELPHLVNRRLEINVTDDLQSTEDWMFRNGVHPAYITFANQNPQILFEPMPKQVGPFCTPRSLVNFSRYHVQLSQVDGGMPETLVTDPEVLEEAQGAIGVGGATQLFATLRLGQDLPKFLDIVKSPSTAKLPKRADGQMLVTYQLAARVDEKTVGPVIEYIERMPAEFTITFGKAACRRDPSLINTQAFGKWCTRNSSLMLAISQV